MSVETPTKKRRAVGERDRPLTAAQGELVVRGLGLIHWAIQKYAPQLRFESELYHLMVAEGKVRLCRAAQTFDPARGKFMTHAIWQIRAGINWVWREYYGQHRRGWDTLRSTVVDREDQEPLDRPDYRETPAGRRAEANELMGRCRRLLTAREWRLLCLRFRDGYTLEETGARLNPPVTRERVRQLESKILEKLRRRFPQGQALFAGGT